jgi:hypothetical protein
MLNYSANGPSGYNLTNSLRYRKSASAYLNRTPSVTGNRQTWTWSAWVKRSNIGSNGALFDSGQTGSDDTTLFELRFQSDALTVAISSVFILYTNAVYRDPSAWYHIVLAIDTTQATASNRAKLYVNGSQVTSFSSTGYPTQNTNFGVNLSGNPHKMASNYNQTASESFDGYMTEVNFIDGQALTPSSFGNTNSVTGVWQPAKYTGTYGTNGFYLKFSDIATTSGSNAGLGKDFSGNANYWTTNNISVTAGTTYDAMTDVPTLTSATVANYCVLNPLDITTSSANTDANLKFTNNAGSAWKATSGTFAVTSGKYYWEVVYASTTSGYAMTGVLNPNNYFISNKAEANFWSSSSAYAYYGNSGNVFTGDVGTAYGNTYTNGDIIGVALDMDNGKIYFSKNGTWQNSGNPATGTNPAYSSISSTLAPAVSTLENGANAIINFGQRPFTYTPPTGFVALNTFNLPSSTIPQGNKVMDATLATGNNSTQVITNAAGFKPDFVWMKIRSASENHIAYDSVRGAQQYLVPNLTLAEATLSSGLTSFNSNGFTLGNANPNYSGSPTFVAWQWQAGQGSTSSNTSGTITSTVSVNASAGFSIGTFTSPASGTCSVGHGLGVKPAMTIVKCRSVGNSGWFLWHQALGDNNTDYLSLQSTAAEASFSTMWGTVGRTSTLLGFTQGGSLEANATHVFYAWAEIAGFSKFGSYTGNGSADGPFIYTGFRPKFVIYKCSSSSPTDWIVQDTSRDTYNVASQWLYANLSSAEATVANSLDFLSNGFKLRYPGGSAINTNGSTYIYMAFAENPFKNALAR